LFNLGYLIFMVCGGEFRYIIIGAQCSLGFETML
jgi:hypothetical protein